MKKQLQNSSTLSFIVGLFLTLVLLAGCAAPEQSLPTPATPAVDREIEETARSFGGGVIASGEIVPSQRADISFNVSGRVGEVLVKTGDKVEAGQVLVALENERLEAAVNRAEAALAAAKAQLAAAEAGPTDQEVTAVEASVAMAEANLVAAESALAQTKAYSEHAVAAAEAGLAQAQGSLDAAKGELSRSYSVMAQLQEGAQPEEVAYYQALLAQAEANLKYPTNVHDQIIDWGLGGPPEEQSRFQMEAAQGARDAALANLQRVQAGPSGREVAAAGGSVSSAQGQVAMAEAVVQAAEVNLAQAQSAGLDVAAAQAQVAVAEAQLAQAQAEHDRIVSGLPAEELAILEAQVDQAEAGVVEAQAALSEAILRAPFEGTIAALSIFPGETVMPGQALVSLADGERLLVETSDLSERDVDRVAIGQPAVILVEALGHNVEGTVESIESKASTIGGDVVYKVTVSLLEPPPELRWGMSVDVEIETI